MKLVRNTNTLKAISLLWLIGMISSCGSYHKLKSVKGNYNGILESQKNMDSKVFFVHTENEIFQITNPSVISEVLSGTLVPINEVELSFYKKAQSAYPKNFMKISNDLADTKDTYQEKNLKVDSFQIDNIAVDEVKKSKFNQQIHIHTEKYLKYGNQISMNLSDISDMQILKKSLKKAANDVDKIVLTVILVIGALIGLLFLILILSCNCPHVYIDNGNDLIFTNTMFTGSVSEKLERYDYKTLPDFHPTSSNFSFQIRNEEKENQFTNKVGLTVAYHDSSVQVIPTIHGELLTIKDPVPANSYNAHDGTFIKSELQKEDNYLFSFNRPTKNGLVSANLKFDKPSDVNNAKLVLKVKNTDWAGFVHQQFLKNLGSYDEKWQTSNQKLSSDEQLAAIKKAGIPLVVYIKSNNKWMEIETIQTVGNASSQSITIPINPKLLTDKQIEIRIDSGFNLWEMDYAAMDFSKPAPIEIQYLSPSYVSGSDSNIKSLLTDDNDYLRAEIGSKPISVNFNGLKTNYVSRTIILQSKGYYVRVDKQAGKKNLSKLTQLSRKNGFGRFSQDLYLNRLTDLSKISSVLNN
jgi:hypothetical protein